LEKASKIELNSLKTRNRPLIIYCLLVISAIFICCLFLIIYHFFLTYLYHLFYLLCIPDYLTFISYLFVPFIYLLHIPDYLPFIPDLFILFYLLCMPNYLPFIPDFLNHILYLPHIPRYLPFIPDLFILFIFCNIHRLWQTRAGSNKAVRASKVSGAGGPIWADPTNITFRPAITGHKHSKHQTYRDLRSNLLFTLYLA
jgi:hypothetical protein